MAIGKRVQLARGSRVQEDALTGLPGEARFDLDRKTLHLHDGLRQGGHIVATEDYVQQALVGGNADAQAGQVVIYPTIAELKAATPSVNQLAILREEGVEDQFVWQAGAGDGGDIASDIQGYWKRLDSQAGLAIQFWRAGLINLQINGTTPATNQSTTAWLSNNKLKLWDSSAYIDANPATWMRLFAAVGGYSTGAFVLPDQLKEQLVDAANLDTITKNGWYRSTTGATGNPVPGVNHVEHREIGAQYAIQRVYVMNDAQFGHWIRYRTNSAPITWSAFTFIAGLLPDRLRASQTAIANADTAVEAGFYRISNGNSVVVIRLDANTIAQIVVGSDGTLYTRTRTGGTWGGYIEYSKVGHTHDDRYYTESEVNSLLSNKADLVHYHDDRYYTEGEIQSILSGYAQVNTGYAVGSYYIGASAPGGGSWQQRGSVYDAGPGQGFTKYLWYRYA